MVKLSLISVLALAAVALGCAGSEIATAQKKGNRVLSIDITENKQGGYDAAFTKAAELGSKVEDLSLDWTAVDHDGAFDMTFPEIANAWYPPNGTRVMLVLRPIDTVKLTLPSQLEGKDLDDPAAIARFEALLENIHAAMPDVEIPCVLIGNEVDGYLGTDSNKWSQFRTFYLAARAKVKQLWGNEMPVSTIVMWMSVTNPAIKAEFIKLGDDIDFFAPTYCPLDANMNVLDTSVVDQHFKQMTEFMPDKKVRLMEIGYPSATVNGSSEAKQATFYREMFKAWDKQATKIISLHIAWLNDWSPEAVEDAKQYYGAAGTPVEERFGGFVGSIGLITYGDSPVEKEAFAVVKSEAIERF